MKTTNPFTERSDLSLLQTHQLSHQTGKLLTALTPHLPPFFIINPSLILEFFHHQNLLDKVYYLAHQPAQANTSTQLTAIRHAVSQNTFPSSVAKTLTRRYDQLGNHNYFMLYNLTPPSSFPFHLPPSIFPKGDTVFLDHFRQTLAQSFTELGLARFRRTNSLSDLLPTTLIVISLQPNEASGVLSPLHDPLQKNHIGIGVQWGLPTHLHFADYPEQLIIDKRTGQIVTHQLSPQTHYSVLDRSGHVVVQKCPSKKASQTKLTPPVILTLLEKINALESQLTSQVSFLFSLDQKTITLSTAKLESGQDTQSAPGHHSHSLAHGIPVSPGLITAPLCFIDSPSHLNRFQSGHIAVIPTPDIRFTPLVNKARGILFKSGGVVSHLGIICREAGIPSATQIGSTLNYLKNSDVITLNGLTGLITRASQNLIKPQSHPIVPSTQNIPRLATKLLLQTTKPPTENELLFAQGIGPVRGTTLYLNHATSHLSNPYSQFLFDSLKKFQPHKTPLYFQFTDLTQNELVLIHPLKTTQDDLNPTIGSRGLYHLLNDPTIFNQEIETLVKLKNTVSLKPLHLILPFPRSPHEYIQVKKTLAAQGFIRSTSHHLFITLDTPSTALSLPEYAKHGLDGIFINFDHFAGICLGIDPGNPSLYSLISLNHPSILHLLNHAFKAAHQLNLKTYAYGALLNQQLNILPSLVSMGITGIAVPPAQAPSLRETLYQTELNRVH